MDSSSNSSEISLKEKNDSPEQREIIHFLDCELYKAAAKGQIDSFTGRVDSLHLLLTPTKNTLLHIHITEREKETDQTTSFIEQILNKCPSLLLRANKRGETPLHIAARHGHDDVVNCLINSAKAQSQDIESGADAARAMLRTANVDKETALHEAARYNHLDVVKTLTKEDPDFTYTANNEAGESPLYLAAERGFWEIVHEMLNTHTSPAYHGPNGRTVLHEAVIKKNLETTKEILEKNKALAKEVDKQGWAPLHYASCLGDLPIVEVLLKCDKSVAYIGDIDGKIPLHISAGCGNEKVVESILACCPDCHEMVDQRGRNVLHFAVESGRYSLTRKLSDKSYLLSLANLINQKDIEGNTPLHHLAIYCHDSSDLIKHPLVDKMAVNEQNLTCFDTALKCTDEYTKGRKAKTIKKLKKAGYEKSNRKVFEAEHQLREVVDEGYTERIISVHIVVAALIVTVTFAAGFTLPGGYNGEGTAVLTRKSVFKAFIITDALALLLSSSALFYHFLWRIGPSKRTKNRFLVYSSVLVPIAMQFMMAAFAAGVSAVIQDSLIGAIIWAIIGCFPLIFYRGFKRIINS